MSDLVTMRRSMWRLLYPVTFTLLLLSIVGCSTSTPAPTIPPANTQAPTGTPFPSATVTFTQTITLAPTLTSTTEPTATPMPTATATLEPVVPFTWKGSSRPLLLSHYMPWYQTQAVDGVWGWHWTMNHFSPVQAADGTWSGLASHFTPLTGPYSSNDEAVLDYQVMLMKLSGIDGVIVDWYGSDNALDYGTINIATNSLFKAIKKAGLKFAICYEDQTIQHMIDNGVFTSSDALKHGQAVMSYLQATWFRDDAYLKVSGKPVLLIFGPQYFTNPDDWKSLFSVVNPQPLFVTFNQQIVPQAASAFPWPPMSASQAGVLTRDALKGYLDDFYSRSRSWSTVVGSAFPGFYDIYQEAGVGNSYGFLDAQQDRTFRFTLQEALDYQPSIIQLVTWNDYGEGTNIEPTVEYGYRYLEVLQELNNVVTQGKFNYTADDLRLPLTWYQAMVKHAGDQNAVTSLDRAFQSILKGDLKGARVILQSLTQ